MSLYNQYSALPYIPYNILKYLVENNENIWKLLKYNTYDALSKENLTHDEKIALLWTQQDNQERYRVFLTNLLSNMIPDATSMLRIYRIGTTPINHLLGTSVYEFDMLFGDKIAMVEYENTPCNRADVFEMELLKTLNGKEVSGVGVLQFNQKVSVLSRSVMNIGNDKTYTGISILMAVNIGNIGNAQ